MLLALHAADAQDAALFTVAAFTGLRLGELRALQWRDLDFTNRLVYVRRSFTHGKASPTRRVGATRSVPMIDQSFRHSILSQREHFTAPDDLVFREHHRGCDR